jgi:hypothetical protein
MRLRFLFVFYEKMIGGFHIKRLTFPGGKALMVSENICIIIITFMD